MLQEIQIKNFAIIETVAIPFQNGLNVLSGETGAGKSILIDAVGLILGDRATSEAIRYGCEQAEIEGLFYFPNPDDTLQKKLSNEQIEFSDNQLIVRRIISKRKGSNTIRINGTLVTLTQLRYIMSSIIDIHGQSEHQLLLAEPNQLRLLDQFGGKDLSDAKEHYSAFYGQYKSLKKEIEEIEQSSREKEQRMDTLNFQINDIEELQYSAGEEEEISQELDVLRHYEQIAEGLTSASELIAQGDFDLSVNLKEAINQLKEIEDYQQGLSEINQELSDAYYNIVDATERIHDLVGNLEFDDKRLNFLEERAHGIEVLKRKYSDDLLGYLSNLKKELENLSNSDRSISELSDALTNVKNNLQKSARQLHDLRLNTAHKLKEKIEEELQSLYMDEARFRVAFEPLGRFASQGNERVFFEVATNRGEAFNPLSKVASGGELSRLILAIKAILSHHHQFDCMIFDEIDTGVSGRVAQAIANKMAVISKDNQVLAISHHPQVAAMADHNYLIQKKTEHGRTVTTVSQLSKENKVTEVARMLAGSKITTLSLEHSKEMIKEATTNKKIISTENKTD